MTARPIRALAFVCVVIAVAVLAPAASALSGCPSHTASAIEQYCETIPSAGGGSTPIGSGAPTVTSGLPARAARRLLGEIHSELGHHRGRAAASRLVLLSMPRRYRHVPIAGPTPGTGGWTLWRILLICLLALLAAAGAAALWRRRARDADPPGEISRG